MNSKDLDGNTALSLAVLHKHERCFSNIVKVLLTWALKYVNCAVHWPIVCFLLPFSESTDLLFQQALFYVSFSGFFFLLSSLCIIVVL